MAISRLTALALLAGCGLTRDRIAPAPLPLDEPLGAGQVRAGRAHFASALLTGESAHGRIGAAFKLYNAIAAFIVQDAGAACCLDVYGGNLVDAAPVSALVEDRFHEMFPIVSFRAVQVANVEVISDGRDGRPAVVRAHGRDAPALILDTLDLLARPLDVEVWTDYVLQPDSAVLELVTTVRNRRGAPIDEFAVGDFLAFGRSQKLFTAEHGFGAIGIFEPVSILGAHGSVVSYAYAAPAGEIQVPTTDGSGTGALVARDFTVPAMGQRSFRRFFATARLGVAHAFAAIRRARGEPLGRVRGEVREEGGGAFISAATVSFFATPARQDAPPVAQLFTDAQGRFDVELPPGAYEALASSRERAPGFPVVFATAPQAAASVALRVGPRSLLTVTVVDGDASLPAKLTLLPRSEGGVAPPVPQPRVGAAERFGAARVVPSADGRAEIGLAPGPYRLVVSRGPEYTRHEEDLLLDPGASIHRDVTLRRVVDTAGWIGADFHQHTLGSIDAELSLRQKVMENLGEGVEFPVPTEHDNVTSYDEAIDALGARAFVSSVPGNEVSVNGMGHFNAYPVRPSPGRANRDLVGAQYWIRTSIGDLFDKMRRDTEDGIVHVSHPRARSGKGYFAVIEVEPDSGRALGRLGPLATSFDAIEVNGDLGRLEQYLPEGDAAMWRLASERPMEVPVLRDWFGLLTRGAARVRPVTALGNSDCHNHNDGCGWPRTYLRVPNDDPRRVRPSEIVSAIRGQRAVVSAGPFITVRAGGVERMGWEEVVEAPGGSVTLEVRVQAAPWVAVSSLEVYAGSVRSPVRPLSLLRRSARELVQDSAPVAGPGAVVLAVTDDVVRFAGSLTLYPNEDSFYVLLVRGDRALSPVASGLPYAYTNPIYVRLK